MFFTAYTDFCQAAFAGLEETGPIRQALTPEEHFQKQLKQQWDFDGLGKLQSMSLSEPSADVLCGPFAPARRIFHAVDIESLRASVATQPISEKHRDKLVVLLDELVIAYLARSVVPIMREGGLTLDVVVERLCPERANSKAMDAYLYKHLAQDAEAPVEGMDRMAVCRHLREFIGMKGGAEALSNDTGFMARLAAMLEFLLCETIELASNRAAECRRPRVVPEDVRMVVAQDPEILALFSHTAGFWQA